MIQFTICVDGRRYSGLFATSSDAVIDALDKFPGAKYISVTKIEGYDV